MPFESVINSRDWDETPYLTYPVGEVPTWSDRRRYNGLWNPPQGLTGTHICNRDWFATGEPWPVTHPEVVYDDRWIPECCGREAEGAQGGVQIGGAAGDVAAYTDATAGGVQIGGAAGELLVFTDATAGGVQIGGAAGELLVFTDATAGGVQIGGAAGELLVFTDATAGGVQLGGAMGDVWAVTDV